MPNSVGVCGLGSFSLGATTAILIKDCDTKHRRAQQLNTVPSTSLASPVCMSCVFAPSSYLPLCVCSSLSPPPILLPAGSAAVHSSLQAMGHRPAASPQACLPHSLSCAEASILPAPLSLSLSLHPIVRCHCHQHRHCNCHCGCQGCSCRCHCCCCCRGGCQGARQQQGEGYSGQQAVGAWCRCYEPERRVG